MKETHTVCLGRAALHWEVAEEKYIKRQAMVIFARWDETQLLSEVNEPLFFKQENTPEGEQMCVFEIYLCIYIFIYNYIEHYDTVKVKACFSR